MRRIGMLRCLLIMLVNIASLLVLSDVVYADAKTVDIPGKYYEFDEKAHYEFESSQPGKTDISGLNSRLSITGNLTEEESKDGVPAFSVNGEDVSLSFSCDSTLLKAHEDSWHLVADKGKEIGTLRLDNAIKKGALVVQVSNDGKNWVTDYERSNYLEENPTGRNSLYTAEETQVINGRFYRIILAYETAVKTGEGKVLMVTTEQFDYKKFVSVFEFYLGDPKNAAKAGNTVRSQKLGTLKKTGHDNGYSGEKDIDIKDPHYGWSIGDFFVSGYTRTTEDNDGNIVLLKNLGDQITLWFNLKQDINKLNGKEELSIAEDTNGYDKYYQTPKMNMGRGTLIIRYTDHQGVAHDPEIYTNYLTANAKANADTIVKLFEEGDYEVTLDYEIKNVPRKIGGVNIVPEYSNYSISFHFAVRNGNCMVYPFDLKTGAELSNKDITQNGFRLDMAKSRYLDIDVKRSVLTETSGGVTEDVRFNRPAKDGDSYTDEGIYTFDVKNRYTGEHTTKVIYVGEGSLLQILAETGYSVSELNEKLRQY